MLGYAIMIGIDGTYDLVEAATWLTFAAENAAPGDWRGQAESYAKDALAKLSGREREVLKARLARWRPASDGDD